MNDEPRAEIVVLADEPVRTPLVEALGLEGHLVDVAAHADDALVLLERASADLAIVQLAADRSEGFDLVARAHELAPSAAILVLADGGSVEAIVEAIKRGADHCLTLPLNVAALEVVVRRALDKPRLARAAASAQACSSERLDRGNFERVVGAHPSMQQLLGRAFQAAQSRATVLIHGETGTGKELIAAAIHYNSKRRDGPFVPVDCASLAETVLESELFGHERGAFTGALTRRRGRFEQAHTGTLFLDEVSEIPMGVQVKLLRFLQERNFTRVGGEETIQVDVRVVAATNRDLKALVDDRTFREDLYYRLNVVRLEVPPLRARPSDVPLLAEHFLAKHAQENDKRIVGLSADARAVLLAHPWPGNVRELQNVIEQAVVLCESDEVAASDLPLGPGPHAAEPLRLMIPGVTLAELERFAILKTLEAVGGSPSKAASILGISRRTIQYRLREWGLSGRMSREGDAEPDSER